MVEEVTETWEDMSNDILFTSCLGKTGMQNDQEAVVTALESLTEIRRRVKIKSCNAGMLVQIVLQTPFEPVREKAFRYMQKLGSVIHTRIFLSRLVCIFSELPEPARTNLARMFRTLYTEFDESAHSYPQGPAARGAKQQVNEILAAGAPLKLVQLRLF